MTDADVDVELKEKGIRIVINPDADKSLRQPNMVQNAFNEFFNTFNMVREDINKQGRKVQALNKLILRKLNI